MRYTDENMEQSILILGRQPALGIAEAESLFGAAQVQPISEHAALVSLPHADVHFARLGGSIKLCKLLTILDTTNWGQIERYLVKVSPEHASYLPEGKVQIGISAYGFSESTPRILATGLSIKKALRKVGKSVRLTPNQEPALNSAQVLHNHLTGPTGWELVIIKDDSNEAGKTIIAQTVNVQDIDGYTLRDRGRPKRDARVGMLPPKLAQIITNLAVADAKPSAKTTILDPFCGTGVVLQEAMLMGYSGYGTDLENRMIDYSKANLEWLPTEFKLTNTSFSLDQGDATSFAWQPAPDVVACETYLGKPFTSTPDGATLAQTTTDCNLIIKKFLRNIANQTKPGTRFCIAIPAWQIRAGEFKHLPLIDSLEDLGYNRVSFEHAKSEDLLYYREDQIVARELVVLTRK